MKRYDIYADSNFLGPVLDIVEENDGRWVEADDAQKLIDLLRFAYYTLRLEIPEGECEYDFCYDFCVVCGNPEFDHKQDCKGYGWKQKVEEILSEDIGRSWRLKQ